MNLLMVDDDITALNSMLSGIDWTECGINGMIWTAHNAKQAEQILERETVDVILCDIEMPGKNGIELIEKVHSDHPDITVIFLTCHAKFEYAKDAIRLGCTDYILTPAPFETVSAVVKNAVGVLIKKRERLDMEKLGSLWLSEQEEKVQRARENHRDSVAIVNETENYVMSNLGSYGLSVQSLAKRTYLHADYLNRIFKREKGVTLYQYIIQERMNLAVRLLQNPSLGAAYIANHVGYSNYSYFVSTFKKVLGHTPAQYRKEILKIEE